jgi:Ethanolamine utilization protein EutJ (predicted chaperonin)
VARKERYIVGLDVGTSTVVCVVCEGMDDNSLHVVGIGVAESRGIKRGVVVNLEAAVDSIKKAIEEAELMAGIEIDSVYLALSGPHVKGFNSRGVIAVAGKNREITRDDVRRAIDAAKAVALPTGREILHVLPQDFVVDEQDGIGAPIGMTGARLEVNVHVVTGAVSSTQNIVACVNRAGVNVVDTVIEQLAAAEAVLTTDEKELGVALVDIGGGTADLAIYERGQSLAHRRHCGRRRSLHERHRRRAAHADSRRGKSEAEKRLRVVVDGGRGRDDRRGKCRRPQAPADGAAHSLRDSPAARGRDLSPGVGRDSSRGIREVIELRHRAHRRGRDSRRDAGNRRADLRSADSTWHAHRCGRPRRSRQQSRVRHAGGHRTVRASQSGARSAADRRGCVQPRRGRLRGIFKEFF